MIKNTSKNIDTPPMASSDEATNQQLKLAMQQGESYRKALQHMISKEAHGELQAAGDYLVGYAVEDAEGMYHLQDGELHWMNPEKENVHIEIAVLDGADGRFIPGLNVEVTVTDSKGQTLGTYEQPFLWHPWLYHYGRNWTLPGDGLYTLQVHIEPPNFMRHDKTNGQRFKLAADVTFKDVKIETGQKKS